MRRPDLDTNTIFEQPPANVFLLVNDIVAGGITAFYGILTLRKGSYVVSTMLLSAAVVFLLSLAFVLRDLRREHGVPELSRRLTLIATVVVACNLVLVPGEALGQHVIVAIMPSAFAFLAARRTALRLTLALGLLLTLGVIFPGTIAWNAGLPLVVEVSTLLTFLVVALYIFWIAELRYRAFERVRFLADHDHVTGLQRFETLPAEPLAEDHAVLVQLLDTDRMRLQGGNRFVQSVMRTLAERLAARDEPRFAVYSYGETSLLVSKSPGGETELDRWTEGILNDLSRPVESGDRSHRPRVSLFIVPRADQLTQDELAGRLETTIQGHAGRERSVSFYDSNLDRFMRWKVELSELLKGAQDRGEIYLAYQPLIDSIDGTTMGAEVLMRWNSPVLGEVSPGSFIPVAEETGLIRDLTEWMLVTAWRESRSDPGMRYRTLSINFSPAHVEQPDFIERVRTILDQHAIDPTEISVEITEGVLLRESIETSRVLDRLTELGFHLSIDDFGTGYSNLSYLKQLRVGRIKIDRSFVRDLVRADGSLNPRETPLVEAMIFMAKTLGISTLAEGIETERQADALRDLGCEAFQGYYFGRPAAIPVGDTPGASAYPHGVAR